MWKGSSEAGMSLVEATIILMVMAILASALSPTIMDYVNDARQVKASDDTEEIGLAIVRLLRDVGLPFPVRAAGASPSKLSSNRVDLLVSEGNIPVASSGTSTAVSATNYIVSGAVGWDSPTGAGIELATDHLVTNANAYSIVTYPALSGPRPGLGWRGGYLSGVTGPDPWGNRYGCTTVWLNPGSDVTVPTSKGTNNDAFCLSAGADGVVDTDIDSNANGSVIMAGDDVAYVFQGNTR